MGIEVKKEGASLKGATDGAGGSCNSTNSKSCQFAQNYKPTAGTEILITMRKYTQPRFVFINQNGVETITFYPGMTWDSYIIGGDPYNTWGCISGSNESSVICSLHPEMWHRLGESGSNDGWKVINDRLEYDGKYLVRGTLQEGSYGYHGWVKTGKDGTDLFGKGFVFFNDYPTVSPCGPVTGPGQCPR